MKKLISLILALAMALSLVACGSSGSSTSGNSSAEGTATGDSAASGDVVNLTIWSPTDEQSVEDWWVEHLAQWNEEHPEIQVSREAIDRSDSYAYENKITTATTSHDLPDILFVDGPTATYYAGNGIIVPITSYFDEDTLSDFTASTIAQGTYDGELYTLAPTESSVAFYYNKDLLTECGVDVEDLDSRTLENPITWSEMAEIAQKCTTADYVGTHIIMDHGEGLPYALEPMYVSNGSDYASDDATTADGYVNGEKAVETTEFLAGLIADGYANIEPIDDEFQNGKCATMIGGSWEVSKMTDVDFEWGVTYYPVSDNTGTAVSPCGDWSAGVTMDCENPDAAGEFMQWLLSTENVATYAAAISKPAARMSAYDEEAMASYTEYPLSVFVDQLENTASARIQTPSYSVFSSAYAEAMTNIFSEAATSGEVDKDYIQSELDNVAAEYQDDYDTNYAE